MEVKVGVIHSSRELSLDTSQSADEINKAIENAINGKGGVFELHDDRGRSIHVPVDKLAYVEITGSPARRVGFGAASG